MHSLPITYETLATTRNEAAIDVLVTGLKEEDPAISRMALNSLLQREEPRAAHSLLSVWENLSKKDVRFLRGKKKWLTSAVEETMQGDNDQVLVAIEVAKALNINEVFPQLIELAETSGNLSIKQAASQAVISMAEPLGRDARADRDQPTVRGPIMSRLVESVRRYSMHRTDALIEAYLLIASWGDGDLRKIIAGEGAERDLLRKRLTNSKHTGVIDLLTGFIRRRKIPNWISLLLATRDDQDFRQSLLHSIGQEPSATVLRNLRDLGMPKSCVGAESILTEIAPEHMPALVYVYTTTANDVGQALHLIAAAIESRDAKAETAAAMCLTRCEIPEIEMWMRASIPVADQNEEAIRRDSNARLLKRLIDLLSHRDAAVVKGVRRVLGPLHADEMLHRFEDLRPRSRRRLGKVVMMVDPDAINRVRDALRHPVLSNRLEAIAMADALAVVDLLADSFAHITREDHQEARVRAAVAMSDARELKTLSLLQEMAALPECQVRDAALVALEKRELAKQG